MNAVIEQRAARLLSVAPESEGFALLRWIPVDTERLRNLANDYIAPLMARNKVTDPYKLKGRSGNGRLSTAGTDMEAKLKPMVSALQNIARALPGIDAVENYPNIRLYDGQANYAIQNFHVDMWTGEPADTIVMMIPLAGDIGPCGVRFTEPVNPEPERYTKRYGQYDAGLEANPDYTEYPVKMQLGYAYLMDSYCLHQSMKGVGKRMSIDYRLRYREKLESDKTEGSTHKKYVEL